MSQVQEDASLSVLKLKYNALQSDFNRIRGGVLEVIALKREIAESDDPEMKKALNFAADTKIRITRQRIDELRSSD